MPRTIRDRSEASRPAEEATCGTRQTWQRESGRLMREGGRSSANVLGSWECCRLLHMIHSLLLLAADEAEVPIQAHLHASVPCIHTCQMCPSCSSSSSTVTAVHVCNRSSVSYNAGWGEGGGSHTMYVSRLCTCVTPVCCGPCGEVHARAIT